MEFPTSSLFFHLLSKNLPLNFHLLSIFSTSQKILLSIFSTSSQKNPPLKASSIQLSREHCTKATSACLPLIRKNHPTQKYFHPLLYEIGHIIIQLGTETYYSWHTTHQSICVMNMSYWSWNTFAFTSFPVIIKIDKACPWSKPIYASALGWPEETYKSGGGRFGSEAEGRQW